MKNASTKQTVIVTENAVRMLKARHSFRCVQNGTGGHWWGVSFMIDFDRDRHVSATVSQSVEGDIGFGCRACVDGITMKDRKALVDLGTLLLHETGAQCIVFIDKDDNYLMTVVADNSVGHETPPTAEEIEACGIKAVTGTVIGLCALGGIAYGIKRWMS